MRVTNIVTNVFAAVAFILSVGCASAAVIQVGPGAFGPAATRLNFDELADQTPIANTYAALGVEFQNALAEVGPFAVSQPNVIVATDLATPIVILFPTGVFRVGIQIDTDGFVGDRQPQVRAFDDLGNLLGTLMFGQGPDFQGFQATSGLIARLELGSCRPIGNSTCNPLGYSDSYDNLVFALRPGSDTPEPSTIAGGAFAALLLVAVRLRRRRPSPM
jgi:hypothetical protein